MIIENLLALGVSTGLLIYLVIVLLDPERF